MATERDPSVRKPDESLLAQALQIQQRDAPRQDIYDEIDALYYNEHAIPFPASIPITEASVVKSGQAAELVDRIDGLFSGMPRYTVFPESIGKEALATSTKIEDWLHAFIRQAEREAARPLWGLTRRDVFLYGLAGGIVIADPRPWRGMPPVYVPSPDETLDEVRRRRRENEEEIARFKQSKRLPILWRFVHGPTIHTVMDDDGIAEVYEIFWDTAQNIARRYPKSSVAEKMGQHYRPEAMVPVLRHANRRYCTYATLYGPALAEFAPQNATVLQAEAQILRQWEHGLAQFEDVPYVVIEGYVTGKMAAEKRSHGVLYHLRHIIRYLDTLLSQRAAYIRLFAWPTPVLRRAMGTQLLAGELDEDGRPIPFTWDEGKLLQLLPGEDISFLVLQGGGQEIEAQVATVMRFIDRLGLSAVTYGQTGADASSGYAISTLLQAAKGKLAPLEEHLRTGAERIARLALMNILALGQTVYVFDRSGEGRGWIGLGPEDLGGRLPQIAAEVREPIEQDLPAKAQTAIQLRQQGIWSLTTAQEHVGTKDPDREQQRVLVDETLRSEPVRQFIISKALERALADLEGKPPQTPPAEVGQASPALAAALANLAGQGEAINPQVIAALQQQTGQPNPQAPPIPTLGTLPGGPVGGAPNLNIPLPAVIRPPAPPPPNAGTALETAEPRPLLPPLPGYGGGGRAAGVRRRPTGPRRVARIQEGP